MEVDVIASSEKELVNDVDSGVLCDETVREDDENVDEDDDIIGKRKPNRKHVIDSDSEGDSMTENVSEAVYTTNAKGELIPETEAKKTKSMKDILMSVCDPETSSDDEKDNHAEEEIVKPLKYKKPRKSKQTAEESQPKKMTPQEAAKQRLEIQSESQRMIREKNISLPYHVPKTYTIKEFLAKRSKLATAKLPEGVQPALALKMAKSCMKEISDTVDERLKQVEEFYKSDESEDEDEKELNKLTNDIQSWLNDALTSALDKIEPQTVENEQEAMECEENRVEEQETKRKTLKEKIAEQFANIQPKLSGGPDDIIDLDEGVTRPSDVKHLINKFFQHSVKRAPLTQETQLKVMEVTTGGAIIEEKIATNVQVEEDKRAIVEIPGAKLNQLRLTLQKEIAEKRSEFWKLKQEQGECVIGANNEFASEKEDYEDDAILDDEDEEEMEVTDEEESEEEDDYEIVDKPKKKSAFIDEEAEESDVEEQNEADDENDDNVEQEQPKAKTLRRIIKPAESDDEDESDEEIDTNQQERRHKTPQKVNTKANLDFLSPVAHLTGLQMNSATKSVPSPSVVSPFVLPSEPSPLKEVNWQKDLKKKLFNDNLLCELNTQTDSQIDLSEICSGTFPPTQQETICDNKENEETPTTQDFLAVCTNGAFNEITTQPTNETKTITNEDDLIISQLIDEAELEQFKKKFDSPVIPTSMRKKTSECIAAREVHATGLINSDDESDQLQVTTMKKKQKKLVFSDDEDDDAESKQVSASSSDDNEENNDDVVPPEDVEYDSEENEIEPAKTKKLNIGDFLEVEAELSESEWGSADENEDDLDVLEVEEGDKEKYDENKVRQEIERIHMRQLLDEDQRDVKLLQELLLDDGELHGTGRQRQFRWKNIDAMTDETDATIATEEEQLYFDEEENEQSFRIMRMKREQFLQKEKAKKSEDIEDVLSGSEILKFGSKVLEKSKSLIEKSAKVSNEQPVTVVNNVKVKQTSFSLLSKRGSFLNRNDQVLQRLAEYNKITATTTTTGPIAVKNSRGFVFQTIDRPEASAATSGTENRNKRKAGKIVDGSTPNTIKKLRLDNISPAISKSSKKVKKSIYTKLF